MAERVQLRATDPGTHFLYLGAVVTMAQFEQVLSRGDTVTMHYGRDAADRSTFDRDGHRPAGGGDDRLWAR